MESKEVPDMSLEQHELDYFVGGFKVSELKDIGMLKWFHKTQIIFKLYSVATAESLLEQPDAERVKKSLIFHSKMDSMVHELVTVFVWKENVLPKLLTIQPGPKLTFPTYTLLYYEIMVHGIIQATIYHGDTFNYMQDSCDDLVEYCIARIIKLIGLSQFKGSLNGNSSDTDPIEDIKKQNEIINFNLGSQCVATMRYICENLDSLPLSVATRIYSTHDVPVLITQLLHSNTWIRKDGKDVYKFSESQWKLSRPDDPPLTKMECQVWLLLRQLMLNTANGCSYNYSDYRKQELTKLIKFLNDPVLDQLSVLVDLQRHLHFLQVRPSQNGDKATHNPLIIEITPLLWDRLTEKYQKKYATLAQNCSEVLFDPDKERVQTLAKIMSGSLDVLLDINEKQNPCKCCLKNATHRCSQCKTTWYCSRSCQVQHWKIHKNSCVPTTK